MAGCRIVSYGVRQGPAPQGGGLLLDATGLRNPAAVKELKHLSGLDREARDYVMESAQAATMVAEAAQDVLALLSAAGQRGRPVHVLVACHSGRHRSVALAESLAEQLAAVGVAVEVHHRDIGKAVVKA